MRQMAGAAEDVEVELEFIEPNDPLFPAAQKLRWDVLVAPFGRTEPVDWHDEDRKSSHLIAKAGDQVLAYSRLIEQGDEAQIRHVAVDPEMQGAGLGTVMMAALVTEARRRGLRQVWLNARMPAVRFYERLGFERVGDPFVTGVVDLEHVRMELGL